MKHVPEALQLKREKLQQAIGDKDLSCHSEQSTLGQASLTEAPTAGSYECGCLSCTSEAEPGAGSLNFRTTTVHAHCVQHATANSSGSISKCSSNVGDCRPTGDSNREPGAGDADQAPSSLFSPPSETDGSFCSSMNRRRSASPRCYSVLHALPREYTDRACLLACECREPAAEAAAPVHVTEVPAASPSQEPMESVPQASECQYEDGCVSPGSRRMRNRLMSSTKAIDGESMGGTSRSDCNNYQKPRGLSREHVSDAPPTALLKSFHFPRRPPRNEEDASTTQAAAATHAGAASVADRSPNARLRGSSPAASPGSCCASRRSAARWRGLGISEDAGSVCVRKSVEIRRTKGAAEKSGKSHKPTRDSMRPLFFGLMHAYPLVYRETRKRGSRTSRKTVSLAGTFAPDSSFASSCFKSSKEPGSIQGRTVRRSASLPSLRKVEDVTPSSGQEAPAEDINHACSSTNSCIDVCASSKPMWRRTGAQVPDTAEPHNGLCRPLMKEAMCGATMPSIPSHSKAKNENLTQQQPTRLQQLRQRIVPKHNPLHHQAAAYEHGSKAKGNTEGNFTGPSECLTTPSDPTRVADGPSVTDPGLSLQQQLEAQDEQLQDIMRQLSKTAENPAFNRLLIDSGWTPEDFSKVESFFEDVTESSAYFPDFSSRTGEIQHRLTTLLENPTS